MIAFFKNWLQRRRIAREWFHARQTWYDMIGEWND